MSAQFKPITMYRNAGWSLILKLYQDVAATTVFPLTGYTAKAQLRAGETQASTLLADITVTIDTIANTITLSIAQSALKLIMATSGFFDVLLIPPGGDPFHLGQTEVHIEDGETVWPTPAP